MRLYTCNSSTILSVQSFIHSLRFSQYNSANIQNLFFSPNFFNVFSDLIQNVFSCFFVCLFWCIITYFVFLFVKHILISSKQCMLQLLKTCLMFNSFNRIILIHTYNTVCVFLFWPRHTRDRSRISNIHSALLLDCTEGTFDSPFICKNAANTPESFS